jgi:hypothetical protein
MSVNSVASPPQTDSPSGLHLEVEHPMSSVSMQLCESCDPPGVYACGCFRLKCQSMSEVQHRMMQVLLLLLYLLCLGTTLHKIVVGFIDIDM